MLEKNGELSDARRGLLRDIERYAASVGCRHKRLVSYFGETFTKDDCGACDYCLGELESVAEPVTVARKILSCVARVGQRFGAAHVTNVLRGSDSEQVRSRGHHDAVGVRPDEGRDDRRAARLHRSAARARPAAAGRRRVSDPADHRRRPGAAEGRRRRAGSVAGAPEAARSTGCRNAPASKPRAGRASIAISSKSCACCAWRLRAAAACRRTSSSTTPRCARSRGRSRRRKRSLRHVYGVGDRKAEDLGELVLAVVAKIQSLEPFELPPKDSHLGPFAAASRIDPLVALRHD